MGALTIRNIDDALVTAIKRRAGEHGISMEEEIRRMLAASYGANQLSDKHRHRVELDQQRILRDRLNDSIARGGIVNDDDLDAALAKKSALLAKEGF